VGEPDPILIDRENPWPGLESFPEGAQSFFHGRDRERDELLRLLRRDTLTLLFGQSGLGKTSLLRAGLFPLLAPERMFPVYLRLDHSSDAPPYVEQVVARIVEAARGYNVDAPTYQTGDTIWEYLHRKDDLFWGAKNYPVVPVLIFDQFEELFTFGSERRQSTHEFLVELRDLIDNNTPEVVSARFEQHPEEAENFVLRDPRVKILITLREDFLPELDRIRDFVHSPVNRLRLLRMNGEQALSAVAQTGGHLVDATTGEAIVRILARAHGGNQAENAPLRELEVEPALLSVFCRELNERRKQQKLDRIDLPLLQGAQEEILGSFYDRSLDDLDPGLRIFVEEKLLTESGFRNSIALEDAVREPGVSAETIQALVNRRLIRLEERFGTQRVELTHDVLSTVARERRDRRRGQAELDAANRVMLEAERQKKEQARRALRRVGVAAGFLLAIALAMGVIASRARLREQVAVRAMDQAMAEHHTAMEERAQKLAALQQVRALLSTAQLPPDLRAQLEQLTRASDDAGTPGGTKDVKSSVNFESAVCKAISALQADSMSVRGSARRTRESRAARQSVIDEFLALLEQTSGQSSICARSQ
jgi:hypothetical protein